MFVDRLEGKTLKQKQEYRAHVTPIEYLNGFISMLCDIRARSNIDFIDQLVHFRDATEDLVTCKWPSVRQWSNLIFYLVEKGRITWSDSQLIHNYRVRTTGPDPAAATAILVGESADGQAQREVPCPDFNSGSCQAGGVRKHHNVGIVKFAHVWSQDGHPWRRLL